VDRAARAARAGCKVDIVSSERLGNGQFDTVLADAPCSGSGSWRRDPQGKWALTPAALEDLRSTQAGILDEIAPKVRSGGHLVYATCSLLRAENEAQVKSFLSRQPNYQLILQRQFTPLQGGDGFFCALLRRA